MTRKILAVLLIICAGFGLLLCVAGLIGVWVANQPVTEATTSLAATAQGYLGLASSATTATDAQIEAVRTQVDTLNQTIAGMTAEDRAAIAAEIRDTVQSRFGPTIKTLRITLNAVTTSLVALNRSLESANRIPGVALPTFTDQLQTADQKLDTISSNLDAVVAAAGDLSVDGNSLEATLSLTSDQLAEVQTALSQMTTQLTTGSTQIGAVGEAAPGVIDLTSVVASLLAVLLGAGQLSLIFRGVALFRQSGA